MISIVIKGILIALFLLVILISALTNKKETKLSSIITLLVVGVLVWVT